MTCREVLGLLLQLSLLGCIGCGGPSVQHAPPSRLVYSNASGLILNCLAIGEPRPKIDWVDDNGDDQLPSRLAKQARVLPNGSLQLLPFTLPAAPGLWTGPVPGVSESVRCRATNTYGSVVSAKVVIEPVLATLPLSLRVLGDSVDVYNSAVLRCLVPSSERSVVSNADWSRNNVPIESLSGQVVSETLVVAPFDLHVMRVDNLKSGDEFRCSVRNSITGAVWSSPPFVLTLNAPRASSRPRLGRNQAAHQVAKAGQLVVLTCNIQSSPPPNFSWFRVKDNLLQPVARSRRVQLIAGTLIIANVRSDEDHGHYRCTARNELGEQSVNIRLDVHDDIKVDVVPGEQVIDIGRKARLECLTEERDRQAITWRKDGRRLATHSRIVVTRPVLQIFNLHHDDYGMYQCFVNREGKETQAEAELRLGDAAPTLSQGFIEQTLQPGPRVSLQCAARGSPTPNISWTRAGFPLLADPRYSMGERVSASGEVVSSVNISNVRVEDGGIFACTATNRAGHIRHSAPLNIYGPPFVHPLGDLKAVVGERFVVSCPVSGFPIESISWTKDDEKLPLDRRQRLLSNGTLVISKVVKKDAGLFACTAANAAGTHASAQGRLRVIVPPSVHKFRVDPRLRLGQRVSMLCSVTDGDRPVQLTWLKDETVLPTGTSKGITVTQLGGFESVLRIDHLRPEHNANFTCQAGNEAGVVGHSQRLVVNVAPLLETFSFPRNLSVGARLRVVCTVREGDRPLSVGWLKNGEPVTSDALTRVRRIDEFTSLLSIAALNNGHAGNYSCVATNAVAQVAKAALLTVQVPPEWISRPRDQSAVEGQDVFFSCRVSGVPDPIVTWKIIRKSESDNDDHPDKEDDVDKETDSTRQKPPR